MPLPREHHYTSEDYWNLPEGQRAELIDGQLYNMAPPSRMHQKLISQFTLYADCRKGNRPSFVKAGNPEHAKALYEYIIEACRKERPVVQQGVFGAYMKVSLVNDGPFTVILDSDELA